MSQQYTINPILQRLSDADSDFRFMALNDLHAILTTPQTSLSQDTGTATRVIDGVLKALDDANGEVQNLAVKWCACCLTPLALKIKETQLSTLLERLASLSTTASDPSIPSTALRLIISALPRYATPGAASVQYVTAAQTSIQRVVLPKLLLLLKPGKPSDSNAGVHVDIIDVLVDVLRCFGEVISSSDLAKTQAALFVILENDRCASVAKKRAVTALSLLCIYASDDLLSNTMSHLAMNFRVSHITPTTQRLLVSITGALARTIPKRFGPYLKMIAPFIISVVDGHDLDNGDIDDEPHAEVDELREGALAALDSFQAYCPEEMQEFTKETIDAGLRYIKYDPNYAPMDEDDEEMGGTQDESLGDEGSDADGFEDDEFEDDGGAFSDDDDVSWKVRRCAAKLLSTVVNTRAEDLLQGVLYKDVAPLLVRRFEEREESVRLEVLATTTSLIRKTGELDPTPSGGSTKSQKKRRRGSDESMLEADKGSMDPPGAPSATRALQKLVPRIGRASAKLLTSKSLSTKQATITLLSSLVGLSPGVTPILSQIMNPIIDIINQSEGSGASAPISATASGTAAASASSLRIEALKFLNEIFHSESGDALHPFLSQIVDCLVVAVNDRFYRLSSQALVSVSVLMDMFVEVISQADPHFMTKIFGSVSAKVSQVDADLEVRERAIEAMGVLLSKTSSNKYISADSRQSGLNLILERLRNETTRLTAARTVDRIAVNVTADDLDAAWVNAVVIELGSQLRKANRALRGSSLAALKSLISNPSIRNVLPNEAAVDLVGVLTPLISPNDLHLCGPALSILSSLIELKITINSSMVESLCSLGKSPLSGGVLNSLLHFVHVIGTKGQGAELMTGYLKLGVTGETSVVAKVIATLLVSRSDASQRYSVSLNDFVKELNTVNSDRGKCLALMVLGESGKQMQGNFPIGPETFLGHFRSSYEEVPLAAAIALGLAASGNPQSYLPAIMKQFKSGSTKDQYLLLHSYKEVIQSSGQNNAAIKPFVAEIWQNLFVVSKNEENKSVAAECVGRLTIIDPATCIPGLKKALSDKESSTRAMVISAIRYTFTDTTHSYDEHLRPVIVDFLSTMIDDSVIENRKLALTTINSAAHNKSYLIAPHLQTLLPKVYRETVIRPELIREVQMGPFKHKVDDGLDVRKHAFETLYAFVETAFPRMNVLELFSRVLVGLEDEHDIKVLCNLMLSKLVILARDETSKRLDEIADRFRQTLQTKPKENAVKQENEKYAELTRSVLRTSIALNRECYSAGALHAQRWQEYYETIKSQHKSEMATLEKEEAKAAKGGASTD